MQGIEQNIKSSLPSSRRVSRRISPKPYNMTFRVEWDPLAFLKDQEYKVNFHEAIETAITLTGSSDSDVQALTCIQYLCQTWPVLGEHTIRLVQAVISSGPGHEHTSNLPDNTKLKAWIHESNFVLEVLGIESSVVEIGQQLAWLGATLRSSPYKDGVATCKPILTFPVESTTTLDVPVSSIPNIDCHIGFRVEREKRSLEPSNGQCWHNMFRNPVIAEGFPILRRTTPNKGLEIPLNMAAGLARTQRVTTFNDKVFLKGFSTMLIASQLCGDMLIWHFLYNESGSRISYLDSDVEYVASDSISNLENARHVVGWCSSVKSYAGAADAAYNIGRSRLPPPHAECVLEKIAITGGKFVTAGATFSIATRETPPHVPVNDYVSKLKDISRKFVVMWDEGEKRGWLVNGISALLHLLRASLKQDSTDKFKSAFKFNKFEEPAIQHTSDSAIELLLNKENVKLEIYPGKGEMYGEETTHKDGLRVGDRVEHFYAILENIIDYEVGVAARSGVKLKPRARKHLEGWDFTDLAMQSNRIYPRVATLHSFGKGWVDFTREIHAITLFGRGFGDIFQPADSGELCHAWAKLPTNKYYIAACVSDLKAIIEKGDYPDQTPIKISESLVWHNLGGIFGPCQCKTGKQAHSDLTQVLFPSKLSSVLPKREPIQLGDTGAVIFGHNALFPWSWKDTGDPEEGKLPTPPQELEVPFHDSAVGSSEGSSTAESSGGRASPMSPQTSSTSIQRNEIPGPSPLNSTDEPRTAPPGQEAGNPPPSPQAKKKRRPQRLISQMFKKLVPHRSDAQKQALQGRNGH